MAKQKLTYKEVLLIKHLIQIGTPNTTISSLIGKVGPKAISKIKHGHRWGEVPAPSPEYGNELYLRLTRLKTLELECLGQ